jgi:hypothetical protein
MLAAKVVVKRDHAAEWKKWLSWLDNIRSAFHDRQRENTVREPTGCLM